MAVIKFGQLFTRPKVTPYTMNFDNSKDTIATGKITVQPKYPVARSHEQLK